MEKHWVCYEVSFHDQRITIYDPHNLVWSVVYDAFSNVSRNLTKICKMGMVWQAHKFVEPMRDQWDVVPNHSPPLVEAAADGGIIAIKIMQCLANKVAPSWIITGRCMTYRKQLCAALFSRSDHFLGRNG